MPADYASAARALSLPVASPPASPPSLSRSSTADSTQNAIDANQPLPPWARPSTTSSRRLAGPYGRPTARPATISARLAALGMRLLKSAAASANNFLRFYNSLPLSQQIITSVVGLAVFALTIVFIVYSHRIFAWLGPVAETWRGLTGGWIIMFLLTFIAAFPPMIGYSTTLTIAGFVYGFPGGWPVAAAATVAGSTAAFVASRGALSRYVEALVGADKRFLALTQILRRDGLFVLVAIRLCPLPFSLSNGFLSTIPSISPMTFAIATAAATPKLMIHIFIGSRLARLAESGDDMSVGDKIVNYFSMVLSTVIGMAVGLFVYRRTIARAHELAREEAAENGEAFPADGEDPVSPGFEDLEEGVLSGGAPSRGSRSSRRGNLPRNSAAAAAAGDADHAALMDDDDISLWEQDGIEDDDFHDTTDSSLEDARELDKARSSGR